MELGVGGAPSKATGSNKSAGGNRHKRGKGARRHGDREQAALVDVALATWDKGHAVRVGAEPRA